MLLKLLTNILAGPLVNAVTGVINKHFDKQINQDVLKADLLKAVLETTNEVAKTQASVIEAEIKSESWLVRTWRPISALCFVSVVMCYAIWVPVSVAYFGLQPLRIGDPLLISIIDLVKICLGGYIGFRSVEKITEIIAGMWRR